MKLSLKIILLFFITGLVFSIGISYNFYSQAKTVLEKEIGNKLVGVTESRANNIETFLEGKKEITELLANDVIFKDFLSSSEDRADYGENFEKAINRIKKIVELNEEIFKISVLNRDGIVVASTDRDSEGINKSVFLNAKNGICLASSAVFKGAREPLISISTPILNENQFLGVLVVDMNLTELSEIVATRPSLWETGEIYLINEEGFMIIPPAFVDKAFLKRKVETENSRHCLSMVGNPKKHIGHQIIDRFPNYAGVVAIGGHAYIPDVQWCLLVEVSEKEAFAPIDGIFNFIIAQGIALTAVFFVIVVIITKSITKPISELRSAAIELGKGNLDVKVGVKSKDEIGELAKTFNKMAQNLKQRTVELEKALKEAEGKAKALQEAKEARQAEKEIKKKARELEEAYRKLKQLDVMKNEFMNIAAHELKTPLIPIIGYTDMLLEGDLGELKNEQRKTLEVIHRNVQRLKNLINDILDISKLEGGAMKFEMKKTQLLDIIKNSVKDLKPFAGKKKLYLKTILPRKMKPVIGDSKRITQVLENLIENAIKFTEKGGITVEAKQANDRIVVSVKDTGIGIPANEIPKLFTKFYQIDSSIQRKTGGTGLGLAISRGIITAHGGRIWVESVLGKGSTFVFELPFKPLKKPRKQSGSGRQNSRKREIKG